MMLAFWQIVILQILEEFFRLIGLWANIWKVWTFLGSTTVHLLQKTFLLLSNLSLLCFVLKREEAYKIIIDR